MSHNLNELKFNKPNNEAILMIKTQTSNKPQKVVKVSFISFTEKFRKKSIMKKRLFFILKVCMLCSKR